MSGDPKKPRFDDGPAGATPDLLKTEVSLDRRQVGPPSPVQYARARQSVQLPQVTPSVPSLGAVVPEGRAKPNPLSPPKSMSPIRSPAVADEPEPLTIPASPAAGIMVPSAVTKRERFGLPPELVETQPGIPGPFARAAPTEEGPVAAEPAERQPPLASETVVAEPAALWRRLAAWLTDVMLVGVLVLLFVIVATLLITSSESSPLQRLSTIALPAAALTAILDLVYTMLFALLWKGRTPGRRLMDIYLVDARGQPPSAVRTLIRAALSLVSFGLFLSGYWLVLFDRQGQTLHDKLTKTFVVTLRDN